MLKRRCATFHSEKHLTSGHVAFHQNIPDYTKCLNGYLLRDNFKRESPELNHRLFSDNSFQAKPSIRQVIPTQ